MVKQLCGDGSVWTVTPPVSATLLKVGGTVTLLANKLRPLCTEYPGINCNQLRSNGANSVAALAPYHPVVPSTTLIVTIVIPCLGAQFQFDNQPTLGSGGRSWTISWRIDSNGTSNAASATSLQTYYNANYQRAVGANPSGVTPVGGLCYVSVTITNYSGQSRTDHGQFYFGGNINTPSHLI